MKHFPLLFSFNDIVLGNGFLASVTIHGRVLAAEEEDGWWMYGVQPGDVAAGGSTFAEARVEFNRELTAVLRDIVEEARDPNTFKAEVEQFFSGVNHPVEEEWHAAVTKLRSGGLTEVLSDNLPVKPADSPRGVEIEVLSLSAITPQNNIQDPQLALAA